MNNGCQYHGYHEVSCQMCRAIAADRQLRRNPVQVDRDTEKLVERWKQAAFDTAVPFEDR